MKNMTKIYEYFNNVAKVINQEADISSVFPNTTDVGLTREGILKKFLENHLPKRCVIIKGGYIFDFIENESKQMDLIIHNDLTLQFNHFANRGEKSFAAIEGCYAAISIKTKLDKQTLEDSLNGFASIPKMPEIKINPALKTELTKLLPIRIIFAFDGIDPDTLTSHLLDYYNTHNISNNEVVDHIIVNNKYIIIRVGKEGATLSSGQKVEPHTFVPVTKSKQIGAYSLLYMLNRLQKMSNIGSQMILDFGKYVDQV